jgi:glutamate-1-semialdehyde 2,1-aminomutase
MRVGIETLDLLDEENAWERLEATSAELARELTHAAREAAIPARVNRVGSMLTLFFATDAVTDFRTAKRADTARFARFFHGMLERGIYLPPSQFEAWFVSLAHGADEIRATAEAAAAALRNT